jgi:hypothetical protein
MEYVCTSPGASSSMSWLTSVIRAPTTAVGSVSAASARAFSVVIGGGQPSSAQSLPALMNG